VHDIRLLSAPPPIVFFYSHPAHRDLHSFPTRRSSDLGLSPKRKGGSVFPAPEGSAARCPSPRQTARKAPPKGLAHSFSSSSSSRSEEHTSELQSRFDLVCRLLLEKKKNDYREYACQAL